jgi:hypothetical protein
MLSSSTQTTQFIGWEKHPNPLVNFWRWLTCTRIPKYKVIETPTTSVYPFPERLAQIKTDIDAQMAAEAAQGQILRRDMTVKRSSSTTPSRTGTSTKSATVGEDDGEWRRKKALDAEETIPLYMIGIDPYQSPPADDSIHHVSFGGGTSDGGGASGSWGESHNDSSNNSYDSDSSSSSYDSGSSSDSSSYDSGSYDSSSSDSGSSD